MLVLSRVWEPLLPGIPSSVILPYLISAAREALVLLAPATSACVRQQTGGDRQPLCCHWVAQPTCPAVDTFLCMLGLRITFPSCLPGLLSTQKIPPHGGNLEPPLGACLAASQLPGAPKDMDAYLFYL
ncbi:hypothetical protein H1C71_000663 [Ictidomys tridecemlineatus]|nr:hypothetical protein H1C71_000663 [Ictidomys tridecemlineatus]